MASFNKITLVGHLGKDPEIRYMTDGTAVCNFSVATTEKRKDRSGEMQEVTLWFRVNVWGKQADAANQYLSKGRQVYVEGRLSQQEFTDKDGNRRTSLEVRATDVQFLGARGEEAGSSTSPPSRPASNSPSSSSSSSSGSNENEGEDIPF